MKPPRSIQSFRGKIRPAWALSLATYDAADEGDWETLFTLCNGYAGVRGALELASAKRTPATLFAGVYDKPDKPEFGTACGLKLLNKALTPALAIAPNFHSMEIEIDGAPIDFLNCEVARFERTLDLARGLLFGEYTLIDRKGRHTLLRTMAFVSLADRHAAFAGIELEAKDYEARAVIRFCNEIDLSPGYIPRLRDYISRSECVGVAAEDGAACLESRVVETGVAMVVAARTVSSVPSTIELRKNGICETFLVDLKPNRPATFQKHVSLFTSLDEGDPRTNALRHLTQTVGPGFGPSLDKHVVCLADKWELADVAIEGDDEIQLGVRWDIFNLIQLGNPDSAEVSIPATGLHGQGYFGHVFWDTEIFMLPFYQATDLAVARNLLLYRYNRLEAARQNAIAWGFTGARFPWTSTWKGYDVTPGDWGSRFEMHISGDIPLSFAKYLAWTGDWAFYKRYGIEVTVETAKFWASRAKLGEDGRYHLLDVVGPDEYHRHANDNYFTNHLATWNMKQAIWAMHRLQTDDLEQFASVAKKTGWNDALHRSIEACAANMFFPGIKDGVCEQHDGYFTLPDVPPLERGRFNMPQGGSHGYEKNSQLNKQADVVMMHYLFEEDFDLPVQRASYEYYDKRCVQGSSLSPAIFCIMGLKVGMSEHSYGYFQATALLDLKNLHLDKNLHEGIHAACAGGTWKAAVFGYGGVSIRGDQLVIAPRLPKAWKSLKFGMAFRGRKLTVTATRNDVSIALTGDPLPAQLYDTPVTLQANKSYSVLNHRADN